MSASGPAAPGPSVTCAIPLAKLTSAAWTPGCLASVRCTRTAQEPQVMPCAEESSAAKSGPDRSPDGVPASTVSATAGDLVTLLLDRGGQRVTGDRRVVVADPDLPGRHIDIGRAHARQRARRPSIAFLHVSQEISGTKIVTAVTTPPPAA